MGYGIYTVRQTHIARGWRSRGIWVCLIVYMSKKSHTISGIQKGCHIPLLMNQSRGIWDHIHLVVVASDWLRMYVMDKVCYNVFSFFPIISKCGKGLGNDDLLHISTGNPSVRHLIEKLIWQLYKIVLAILLIITSKRLFFISSILKGRYMSHTHLCRRYLWHTQYASVDWV